MFIFKRWKIVYYNYYLALKYLLKKQVWMLRNFLIS